jgi:hypothetical protein
MKLFPDIFKIGKNNWIFVQYCKTDEFWHVFFTKHVHCDESIEQYDFVFELLEKCRFSSHKELSKFMVYHIGKLKKLISLDLDK